MDGVSDLSQCRLVSDGSDMLSAFIDYRLGALIKG